MDAVAITSLALTGGTARAGNRVVVVGADGEVSRFLAPHEPAGSDVDVCDADHLSTLLDTGKVALGSGSQSHGADRGGVQVFILRAGRNDMGMDFCFCLSHGCFNGNRDTRFQMGGANLC